MRSLLDPASKALIETVPLRKHPQSPLGWLWAAAAAPVGFEVARQFRRLRNYANGASARLRFAAGSPVPANPGRAENVYE